MTAQYSAAEPSVDDELWRPYRSTEQAPWDLRRAVHLHRRTGFAATWNELQRDLRDGPDESIDRVLAGTSREEFQRADFESTSAIIGRSAARSNHPDRLKAWWLFRMLFTPDPLAEKLALMWHNHFATSNLKVANLEQMRRQNRLLLDLGGGPFGELLSAVVHDPAMLYWLDAPFNHKGHPNENLGREIMELFTLGVGHYTEQDVKEAARALTGWTVVNGEFDFRSELHDTEEKTILGRGGRWTGDDLVEMLLDHPATSRRIAWRLCSEFLGEDVAGPDHIETLAVQLRASGLDVGRAVATILRSELFFTEANIRSRVAGPVEFVVGAVRALEQLDPPPETIALADWTRRLGQDLFYPPNVGGWHGGRDWLRTGALIGRANFTVALVSGRLRTDHQPPDWSRFAADHGRPAAGSGSGSGFAVFLADLLFGGVPDPDWIAAVDESVTENTSDAGDRRQRVVAAALSSPEAQLL